MSIKRTMRAVRHGLVLALAVAAAGLGGAVTSVPVAVPAGASGPLAPTIYVANTGNGVPETITSYPFPSTGNIGPSATVSSGSAGVYQPYDMAFDPSGDLWVPSYVTGTISEYTPSQLSATGHPSPHVVISGDTNGPTAVAFDSAGNLWVVNSNDNTLVEYPSSDLTSSGSPTPATVVSSSSDSIDYPSYLTFDSSGDLWLTEAGNSTVVELTGSQLAAGGPQPATATITATGGSLDDPTGLAFDSSGDLWVANAGSSTVVEYQPGQLGGGAQVPYATLNSTTSNSIFRPYQIAFDSSGDLWVANSNLSTVTEFASDLLVSGSTTPAPTATLTTDDTEPPSIDYVETLAFDSSGDLWLGNYNANDLVRFSPTQLGGGSPTPGVVISSSYQFPLDESTSLALDGSGDLWAVNPDGDNIVEYPAGVADSNGSPVPSITIGSGRCDILCYPTGLAFDSSGDLWVANHSANQDTIVEYTPAQLASSGDPTPAVELTPTTVEHPFQLAFDATGDLWITSTSNSSLVELSASQLSGTVPDPTPAVTISGLDAEPYGLAVDQSGDLWWSDCSDDNVTELAAHQLTANASDPSPASVLTGPTCVQQMAFDSSGDLWVAGYGEGPIGDFTPGQLSTGGPQSPTDAVAGSDTGLDFPAGLALGQPPAAPGAVTATFCACSASVTWTAPFSIPWVTGYSVTPVVNGVAQAPVDVDAGTSSYTLPGGTTSGTTYAFKVAAVNAFGSSPVVTSNTVTSPPPTVTVPPPTVSNPPPPAYYEVASDGGVFTFGTARFYGSTGAMALKAPVVGMATTPDGEGYWLVAADGGVFTFGDAHFYGSTGAMALDAPVVGMAATPDGKGYWLVASDGGIFCFGDARFYGSAGGWQLISPIVGMAATPDGKGYWLVASDGDVVRYGDAPSLGSADGLHLNEPVVGMATTPDGKGYWEVASDGGVFSYGDAKFYGSKGSTPPTPDVVGMIASVTGDGYLEAGASGAAYGFGDQADAGSAASIALKAPMVGIAAP